ncbi:MAG TPA: N-acetylmuramoyl-L-alanine amidase, partial [Tepidisphaeraceae bacterium]
GDAISLAQQNHGFNDHFLIGNGDGAVDGEIQIGPRWNQQQAPALDMRVGAEKAGPQTISICVVGDFDRTVPTPTQIRRLAQLIGTLQGQLHIPRENVITVSQPHSIASAGKYFPATALKKQLLP